MQWDSFLLILPQSVPGTVTSRRVFPGSGCVTGQLFVRGKIKSECLVQFRALKAACLCHSKSHLDANSSLQVEGFDP